MSLRQMLASWIAGKPKEPMTPVQTKIVVLTGKQKQFYAALVKARAKRGAPAPTVEEYAAYLRGDAPLASGRMKRTPSWKVQQ